MTEQELAPSVEIATPQEPDTQASEAQEQSNYEQRPSADAQERNWRALRESNEAKDRQIAELTSIAQNLATKKEQQESQEEDIDLQDVPTLAQANSSAEKIAINAVNKALARRKQEEAPDRLKRKYSDFDEVVSRENVDHLKKQDPELAASLSAMSDQYSLGVLAYNAIKSRGIAKGDSVSAMKKDAYRNTAKPVSPNAVAGKNSVGDANMFSNGLTPDLKKHLYKEMIDSAR